MCIGWRRSFRGCGGGERTDGLMVGMVKLRIAFTSLF
jgi:hypothetical protein